jgi:biopolymer transport protein ExbD
MKNRSLQRRSETSAAVNATPLIDVVLCMIVFFLIVGKLAESQRLAMDLPEARTGESEQPRESFVINLVRGGGLEPRIVVAGEDVDLEQMERQLRERAAETPDLSVEVRAPGDAPYRWIERAMDACARAGVADVRLAASRPREGGGS